MDHKGNAFIVEKNFEKLNNMLFIIYFCYFFILISDYGITKQLNYTGIG